MEPKIFKAALVSPNDDGFSREEIKKGVEELNKDPVFKELNTFIKDVKIWEDDPKKSLTGNRGQITVDEFIGDVDIIIGVFCNKVGTTYENVTSATVHEIYNALMRKLSKRYEKGSLHISVYFLKSNQLISNVKEDNDDDIENIKKVRALRKNLLSYGIVVKCDNIDELKKAIKDNLIEYARERQGKAGRYMKKQERINFIGNLITQKVIAYLEMDRGYSERTFKLFDKFKFGENVTDKYGTNLIFNYGILCSDYLYLLRQSFDNEFSHFICGKLEEELDVKNHDKHKEQNLHYKINFENFKEVARIIDSSDDADDVFSYEALFVKNEKYFVQNITEILKSNNSSVTKEEDKALVFMAANLSERFLQNVEKALSELPDENDPQNLPKLFLFSVLPIPRSEELRQHILKSDDLPRLKSFFDKNKLYNFSYLTKEDLNDGEGNFENAPQIFRLIYGKEKVVGGDRVC